jgi:DNA-binding MarR family transcriptional regulator
VSRQSKTALLDELMDELRGFQNAVDQVDETVCDLAGINRTDARCIDLLDRRGTMAAGQLAEATGLTTGAVTAVLDRLEAKGFVRRARDEHDRRRVLVEPTAELRRLGEEYYSELADAGKELGRYSTDELVLLRDFMRRGRELNEAHAARLRERAAKRS